MESIIVGVFHLALFLMIFLILSKQERKNLFSQYKIGTAMFTFNLCCFGLSFGVGYAARLAALFGPYMIIYIPQMLNVIESKTKRQIVTWIVVVVCGCQYILRLFVNNIGGTMPYSFFW